MNQASWGLRAGGLDGDLKAATSLAFCAQAVGVLRYVAEGVLAEGGQVISGPFCTDGRPRKVAIEVSSTTPTTVAIFRTVGAEPEQMVGLISSGSNYQGEHLEFTPAGKDVRYRAVLLSGSGAPKVSISSVEGEP